MSEYEKGYAQGFEHGKSAMRNEIASNPLALFELLPNIANTVQEQLKSSEITTEQRAIIEQGLKGGISHTELIEKLHNTMRNNA